MSEVLRIAIERTQPAVVVGEHAADIEQYRRQAAVLHEPRVPYLLEINDIAAGVLLCGRIRTKALAEQVGVTHSTFTHALGYLTANKLLESVRVEEEGARHYYFQPSAALLWAAQQPAYEELHYALEDHAERLTARASDNS